MSLCFLVFISLVATGTAWSTEMGRVDQNVDGKYLYPEVQTSWGTWGGISYCPHGTWARGFDLKVEGDQGSRGDDSALNAIKLFCR